MRDVTNWIGPDAGVCLRLERRLHAVRSAYQLIEIWQTTEGKRLFCLNGFFMTHEGDEFIHHESLVHPIAVTHPRPRSALIIGGGDGGSARQLLRHPTIELVHIVELDKMVVELARRELTVVHQGALDDARVRISYRDGLAFMTATDERYDLIVLDLSDNLGTALPLYTVEFYRACRARLQAGGLLSLHVAAPQKQAERFKEIIGHLRSVFPVVRPYCVPLLLYGGLWSMAAASIDRDPASERRETVQERIRQRGLQSLAYYNEALHHAQFALPNFVRRLVEDAT